MLVWDNSLLKQFKEKHKDQSAIVFGTGPSLEEFNWSLLPETPNVSAGVNYIIFRDEIKLDYYFSTHYIHRPGYDPPVHYADKIIEQSWKYKNMKVFIGAAPYARWAEFPIEKVEKMHDAIVFELTNKIGGNYFAFDIVSMPFYNHSIIFSPLQLLLYAGVKKIYLVGCDCGGKHSCIAVKDGTGKLQNKRKPNHHITFIGHWRKFLRFKMAHYPDVEIISVNPVRLTGMFTDLYL